jgi:hypothetical protein
MVVRTEAGRTGPAGAPAVRNPCAVDRTSRPTPPMRHTTGYEEDRPGHFAPATMDVRLVAATLTSWLVVRLDVTPFGNSVYPENRPESGCVGEPCERRDSPRSRKPRRTRRVRRGVTKWGPAPAVTGRGRCGFPRRRAGSRSSRISAEIRSVNFRMALALTAAYGRDVLVEPEQV